MLTSLRLRLFFLLIGPCLHFVSASWSIWPISWSLPWVPTGQRVNELYCKRARHDFLEYCEERDREQKLEVSRSFLSCFLKQAGGKLEWGELQDFENLEETGSTIIAATHDFVDKLCSNDGSLLENSLTWFNGDSEISRSLQNLSDGTQNVVEEGNRIRKLFSNASDTFQQFKSFSIELIKMRNAYLNQNASIPQVPDFDIIHDELWIMVQDTVDLFDSHLHMISYFKTSLRDDLKNMERAGKTLDNFGDLSLFWGSYTQRMERLSKEAVRNKEMRTKVLYPWLFNTRKPPVPKHHTVREAARKRTDLGNIKFELRERFRFKLRNLFWLLVDNMELFFRAYVRFAFDRFVRNVLESSSLPNWILLGSSLLAHLLTVISVIFKVSIWTAKQGISFVLFLGRQELPRGPFRTKEKRQSPSGHLENTIRMYVKEHLKNAAEEAEVQMMLQSVCQRELDISLSKLRSVERRLLTLCRDMRTLEDRAESLRH